MCYFFISQVALVFIFLPSGGSAQGLGLLAELAALLGVLPVSQLLLGTAGILGLKIALLVRILTIFGIIPERKVLLVNGSSSHNAGNVTHIDPVMPQGLQDESFAIGKDESTDETIGKKHVVTSTTSTTTTTTSSPLLPPAPLDRSSPPSPSSSSSIVPAFVSTFFRRPNPSPSPSSNSGPKINAPSDFQPPLSSSSSPSPPPLPPPASSTESTQLIQGETATRTVQSEDVIVEFGKVPPLTSQSSEQSPIPNVPFPLIMLQDLQARLTSGNLLWSTVNFFALYLSHVHLRLSFSDSSHLNSNTFACVSFFFDS